jgi:hypothetical protein
MVLCPVAIAIGCKKCPIFAICPVKSLIGDYKPGKPNKDLPSPGKGKSNAKQ